MRHEQQYYCKVRTRFSSSLSSVISTAISSTRFSNNLILDREDPWLTEVESIILQIELNSYI